MKLKTSYKVRDTVLHQYISIPIPTVKDAYAVYDHIAWIAGRDSPTVEILES